MNFINKILLVSFLALQPCMALTMAEWRQNSVEKITAFGERVSTYCSDALSKVKAETVTPDEAAAKLGTLRTNVQNAQEQVEQKKTELAGLYETAASQLAKSRETVQGALSEVSGAPVSRESTQVVEEDEVGAA